MSPTPPSTSWPTLACNVPKALPSTCAGALVTTANARASGTPLHLPDTEAGGEFKQYLKTARMGSAIYVPMVWQDRFLGQIVLAARGRNSLSVRDFATMRAAARRATL